MYVNFYKPSFSGLARSSLCVVLSVADICYLIVQYLRTCYLQDLCATSNFARKILEEFSCGFFHSSGWIHDCSYQFRTSSCSLQASCCEDTDHPIKSEMSDRRIGCILPYF